MKPAHFGGFSAGGNVEPKLIHKGLAGQSIVSCVVYWDGSRRRTSGVIMAHRRHRATRGLDRKLSREHNDGTLLRGTRQWHRLFLFDHPCRQAESCPRLRHLMRAAPVSVGQAIHPHADPLPEACARFCGWDQAFGRSFLEANREGGGTDCDHVKESDTVSGAAVSHDA